jgi:D-hexose-6-phosphate mutarotase
MIAEGCAGGVGAMARRGQERNTLATMTSPLNDPRLETINRQLANIDGVSARLGQGGLPMIQVSGAQGEAEIYLHGAHVTAFRPRGEEPVLFMSQKSLFQPGKAIRGGVPICFPWFGAKPDDPSAGQHGFARLREWSLQSAEAAEDATIVLSLGMESDEQTRKAWPHDFSARYQVMIGSTLRLRLEVTNRDSAVVRYEDALHSYFVVANVGEAVVKGLDGVEYLDRAAGAGGARKKQRGEVRFEGEVDRLYLDTVGSCVIEDSVMGRKIRIAKSGSRATVVWNPHIAKAKAMADFGDDEWVGMCCVETANANSCAIELGAGQTHTTETIIAVEPVSSA